jgi:hypothetical protein
MIISASARTFATGKPEGKYPIPARCRRPFFGHGLQMNEARGVCSRFSFRRARSAFLSSFRGKQKN